MKILIRIPAQIAANGFILFLATNFAPNFHFTNTPEALIAGAIVISVLHIFIKPIVSLISLPLIWITFGLFHIIISVGLLWLADYVLADLTISSVYTLVGISIVFGLINSFFSTRK